MGGSTQNAGAWERTVPGICGQSSLGKREAGMPARVLWGAPWRRRPWRRAGRHEILRILEPEAG